MAGFKDAKRDRENRYRRAAMLHPLRRRIGRLLLSGEEIGASEIAAELKEPPEAIAYHLQVLRRHGMLKVVFRPRPAPPLYRFSPEAEWAREMLAEEDE